MGDDRKIIVFLKPCLDILDLPGGSKYMTGNIVLSAVTHLKLYPSCLMSILVRQLNLKGLL